MGKYSRFKLFFLLLVLLPACQKFESTDSEIQTSTNTHSKDQLNEALSGVVYGSDSREEAGRLRSAGIQRNREAVVALIPWSKLKQEGNRFVLNAASLLSTRAICPDEPFANQIAAAHCSGVLIKDQQVLTAGHCFSSTAKCEDMAIVFDFFQADGPQDTIGKWSFTASQVFSCQRILKFDRGESEDQRDYAVLQLTEPALGRELPRFRFSNDLAQGDDVYSIGHPLGLPQKYSDGKVLERKGDNQFRASLDGFSGQSGAPVFLARTNELVGIYLGGEEDLEIDPVRKCRTSRKCDDDHCKGEVILKINRIKKLL